MAPDDWEHYIIMSQIGRQLAQADSFSWCVGGFQLLSPVATMYVNDIKRT